MTTQSRCPSCKGVEFIAVPAMVGGLGAVTFIQCSSCGSVVGTSDAAATSRKIDETMKDLRNFIVNHR